MSDGLQLTLSLFVIIALSAKPVSQWVERRLAERRATKWMAEKLGDRNPKDLIDASPFSYGHWQGEDGYRLMDDRVDPPYVGFAPTVEHAEVQILAMILREEEAHQ